MAGIEVNISGEEIQSYLVQAILDSTLGDKVKEVVEDAIRSLTKSVTWRDGPLEKAIRSEVQKILMVMIREEYQEKFRTAIREQLTDEMVFKLVSAAAAAYLNKV